MHGKGGQNWVQQLGEVELLLCEVAVRSGNEQGIEVEVANLQRDGQLVVHAPWPGNFLPGLFEPAAGKLIRNPAESLRSCVPGKCKPPQQGLLPEVIAAGWFYGHLGGYVVAGPAIQDLVFPFWGHCVSRS